MTTRIDAFSALSVEELEQEIEYFKSERDLEIRSVAMCQNVTNDWRLEALVVFEVAE